jgi:hypothetical protein
MVTGKDKVMNLRIKPEEKGTFGEDMSTVEATTQTCTELLRAGVVPTLERVLQELDYPGVDTELVKRIVDRDIVRAAVNNATKAWKQLMEEKCNSSSSPSLPSVLALS